MEHALRCAAEDGTPQFALLNAVHRYLPGHAARVFYEDRTRLLRALTNHVHDLTPVSAQTLYRSDEDTTFPPYGWWRATLPDDGSEVEIALSPAFYGNGGFVLAGPHAASLDALMEAALADATRPLGRCLRYSGGWQDAPDMETETDKVVWDDIVLPMATLSDIRSTIDSFFAQKETFAALRFPWRRGVLLIGPPGTGKTMVCKAAAATYRDVPFLYVRDMNNRGVPDVIAHIFARARKLAPCILAFEDIDGLIGKESRTVFLNELDGFRGNDGILIIASSNHPGQIDEALLKRPSRFDRVYHIGLPEAAERSEFSRRLLARTPDLAPDFDIEGLAAKVAGLTEGFTPAYLKEAFLSARLQLAQDGHVPPLGDIFSQAVLDQIESLRKYLKKAKNPDAMADFLSDGIDNIGFRPR